MPETIQADLLLGRDTLSPGLVKAGQAASDASDNIRQLTRDLYEVGKQRATPVVDLQDADATAKLEDVAQKLRDLGSKAADPSINVDDKKAQASLADMRVKLDALGRKVASPRITLEGLDRAEAQILRLDLMLDALDRKTVTPDVTTRGGFFKRIGATVAQRLDPLTRRGSNLGQFFKGASTWRGLFSGGTWRSLLGVATGGSSAAGGAGGEAAAAADAAGSAGSGGLPFLLSPAGIGLIASALPIIASLADAGVGFGAGALGAAGAAGSVALLQPSVLAPGLTNIKKTLSTVTQSFGPSLGLLAVQFGKFVQGLAPTLAKLFGATLPFFKSFLSFAEQAAKIALPALTQVMQQMVSSGALKAMTQGFVILVQGLAGFIKELGPGFKAGALIFRGLAIGIRDLLYGLGAAFGWLGKITGTLISDLHDEWDSFRHDTATIFDGVRHDIAQIWDGIYQDTIGQVVRLVRDVTGWFDKLPPGIRTILSGLGKMLYGIGTGAISDFLHGLESVAGSVLSWIGNFVSSIWDKVKKFFGIASPSALFYDAGKNLMLGLAKGIREHAHHAAAAASAASGVTSGALGGDEAANRALAERLFPWPRSMWAAFQNLVMDESGFNRFALNPSSGAYGIAQALPPTKYPFAGQAAGGSHAGPQLSWMFSYIAGRYGNPVNALAHENAYHWYGSGLQGGVFTQPTLIGVGERGPERVDITPLVHPGSGAQPVVVEFHGGSSDFDQFMLSWLRRTARIVGGGDVQLAYGRR